MRKAPTKITNQARLLTWSLEQGPHVLRDEGENLAPETSRRTSVQLGAVLLAQLTSSAGGTLIVIPWFKLAPEMDYAQAEHEKWAVASESAL